MNIVNLFLVGVLTIVMLGCSSNDGSSTSSSSSGSASPPPVVGFPAEVLWSEGEPLVYTLSAESTLDLRFLLLSSADADLFTLDETTGVLSKSAPLDFEAPVDANLDGVYELSVAVIDSNNQTTTKYLKILTGNVDEYSVDLRFPADGSNLGGMGSKIHFRGGILIDEVEYVGSEGVRVLVNGVAAEFTSGGEWLVEVPIDAGKNEYQIDIEKDGLVSASKTLEVENTPIVDYESMILRTAEEAYALTLDRAMILAVSSSGELSILARTNDEGFSSDCARIYKISLTPLADELLIQCNQREESELKAVFLLNTKTKLKRRLIDNLPLPTVVQPEWLTNEILVVRNWTGTFWAINSVDLTAIEFKVKSENPNVYFYSQFFAFGSTLYLVDQDFTERYEVDLSALVAGTVPVEPLVAIYSSKSIWPNNVGSVNGKIYQFGSNSITELDIDKNVSREIVISDENMSLFQDATDGYYREVYSNLGSVFLYNSLRGNWYQVSLVDGATSIVHHHEPLPLDNEGAYGALSIGESSKSGVLFTNTGPDIVTIDLESYAIVSSNIIEDSQYDDRRYIYARTDYDSERSLVYQYRVYDWTRLSVNEENSSLPLVVLYDLEKMSKTPILLAEQIFEYFADAEAGYRIGTTIATSDANVLWFSAWVDSPTGRIVGVYSYNMETRKISVIHEIRDGLIDGLFNEPFLSAFVPDLGGAILTAWALGYVKILTADGWIEELVEAEDSYFDSYFVTRASAYDPTENRVYVEAIKNINPGSFDWPIAELISIDVASRERQVIASNTKGSGLHLSWFEFDFDEARKLLLAVDSGYMWIVDVYSGDRVLKALH